MPAPKSFRFVRALLDEQHLAVRRQRPEVVGDDALQLVAERADGIHRRQYAVARVAGVDEGVTGMRVGERRKLVVPPSLDGRTFDPSFIPPGSILHYDVELVEIVAPAK